MGQLGYFIGIFMAAAGVGYIWLGLLWLVRARKRWPRAAHWSAVGVTGLVGVATSAAEGSATAGLGTLAAIAFIVWRSKAVLFKRQGPTAISR